MYLRIVLREIDNLRMTNKYSKTISPEYMDIVSSRYHLKIFDQTIPNDKNAKKELKKSIVFPTKFKLDDEFASERKQNKLNKNNFKEKRFRHHKLFLDMGNI